MDANEFKKFCNIEFAKRGFSKFKSSFYCQGNGVLCSLSLQHSDFGPMYYINFYFYIGDFSKNRYPSRYDYDFRGRLSFMSKTETIDGKPFLGGMVEYDYYTEDELQPYFVNVFETIISPVLENGKKAIIPLLENDKCHANILRETETLGKLKEP